MLRESPNAPLFNRATQGLSQPGAILESVILGTFWDQINQTLPITPVTTSISLNGFSLNCQRTPSADTWESVFAAACPAPFSNLGTTLDISDIQKAFDLWQLTKAPNLEIPTLALDWDPTDINVVAEILGQGDLLVTPLQMVNVAAIIGNEGQFVRPHLLMQPLPGCGEFSTTDINQTDSMSIISPASAAELRALLPRYGEVIGHNATALAGPNRIQSWFIGLNSLDIPRYAVAILIESDSPLSGTIKNRDGTSKAGYRLISRTLKLLSEIFP